MDFESRAGDRHGKTDRSDFPERANPNLPVQPAGGAGRETWGEAPDFPDRCDPRHAYRPLTEEQRGLVTRYLPMAQKLARQSGVKPVRTDELEAEAYGALVDAARTFDPDRGVDFAVYARPRIVGALRDYARFLFHGDVKDWRRQPPVFERLSPTEELQGRVLGMEEPHAPFGPDFEVAEAVESMIRRLKPPEATACRLLYFEGKSFGEAAEVLGCTKGYVSRLHSDALERIRRVHRGALAG